MKIPIRQSAFAALALAGLAVAPANAQNTLHDPFDLVLTFQNPGGTQGSAQTVTVALGNIISVFRDAAPGSFTLLNTANISGLGLTLGSTFGSQWYDQSTLWMGAVGFFGTSTTSTQIYPGPGGGTNPNGGDPHQTLYFSKVRETAGNAGFQGSPTPTTNLNTGTGITGGIGQVKGRIEAVPSGSSTAIFVEGTGTSFIDENNPFTAPGVQSAAYTNIGNGVQGSFGAGNFGAFGAAGTVELALDLYRLQNRSDVAGQYGFGEATNEGEFLGTITIDQSGQVGFLAVVPEPSSAALLGVAALGLLARRRRHA